MRRAVDAERAVEKGTTTSESERHLPVDQQRDDEHPDQRQEASMIGGNAITMLPIDAAWMLIWLISWPVWRSVVEGQREALGVGEQVAAQVQHHVLLDLRVDVVVQHAEAVADDHDQEPESRR